MEGLVNEWNWGAWCDHPKESIKQLIKKTEAIKNSLLNESGWVSKGYEKQESHVILWPGERRADKEHLPSEGILGAHNTQGSEEKEGGREWVLSFREAGWHEQSGHEADHCVRQHKGQPWTGRPAGMNTHYYFWRQAAKLTGRS